MPKCRFCDCDVHSSVGRCPRCGAPGDRPPADSEHQAPPEIGGDLEVWHDDLLTVGQRTSVTLVGVPSGPRQGGQKPVMARWRIH
jgi:hypothetical protein